MNNSERIADTIEEVIGCIFVTFKSTENGPTEYLLLYHPRKQKSWLVVIFFTDALKLKSAIKSGICYQLHSHLLEEFDKTEILANIPCSAHFEYGNRPMEQKSIEQLHDKLILRSDKLQKSAGRSEDVCSQCGHDFNSHQMLCNLKEGKPLSHGWMMCPESDCMCFCTWSANFKG
jgi:hypothetical protein